MPLPDEYLQAQIEASQRFKVDRPLGRGGSGAVFRAYDQLRGEWIALKYLTVVDPGSLFRFKSEFRKLSTLSHPNLLQLHELITHDDRWLLTMELIDGCDLLTYLHPQTSEAREDSSDCATAVLERAPGVASATAARSADPARDRGRRAAPAAFDESEVRRAFLELAEGLCALHRDNRLHRDLKPANVLVASDGGRVVICDFGLALEAMADEPTGAGEAVPEESNLFAQRPSQIAGTLAYMSPEQAAGRTLTPASDWYSAGVMLYQALTGRMPFNPTLPLRAALRVKLGVQPTAPLSLDAACPPDLSELALALLAPDPERRPDYAAFVERLAGRSQVRRGAARTRAFVGRAPQLEQLLQALDQSRGGAASLALVSGPSGAGKSALIRRFLARAERDGGALVLRARCYEREELPYKAIDPLLDAIGSHLLRLPAAALESLLPSSIAYLAALFPALLQVPAIAAVHEAQAKVVDPRERRRHALVAFRELCARLGRERPLVLVIDDLQWGDADSSIFLQTLVAPPAPPPVLVVCAYRSGAEPRSALLRTLREAHALDPVLLRLIDVTVGPLSTAEAHELARQSLGSAADAEHAAELIAREAGGSPFFIEELAAYAVERGLEAARTVRLEELLVQQLESLPAAARSLLSLVALSGQPIAFRILRAAAADAGVARGLRELEGRRLVTSVRERGEDWFEAAHDRVREAVCRLVAPPDERRLHRALAETYEAQGDADVDALRKHWVGAGERDAALRYTLLGAEAAERALAFARASDLYREALSLLAPADARTRDVEDRLGRALIFAGRGAEAAELLLRLVPGADDARALEYRMLATTQLLRCGKLSAGFAELQRARDVFGVDLPRSTARAFLMLAARKARIRVRELQLSFGPVRPEGDREAARLSALWEVSAALTSADFLRGSVYGAELAVRALRLGDPVHVAAAAGLEAISAAAASDMRRLSAMRALSRRAAAGVPQDHELLGRVLGMESIAHWLVGEWSACVRLSVEAEEQLRRGSRLVWDLAMVTYWGLAGAAYLGDLAALVQRVPEMVRDAEARGDRYAATSFRTHLNTWAWLAIDRADLADHHADVAERRWTPDGYQFQKWHMTFSRTETALYPAAESAFAALGMALHACAAKLRRGELIAGPAGAALASESLDGLRALGAARPERFARILAPRAGV